MTRTFADFKAGALKRDAMRYVLMGVAADASHLVDIEVVEDRRLLTSYFRVYAPLYVLEILAAQYPASGS